MLQLRDSGGTLRTITTLQMRDAGGTLRTIASLYVRDSGGTLRQVFSATGGNSSLVTPNPVHGSGRSDGPITITTMLAKAQGGTAYAWSQTSGDANWSIGYPSSAQTFFTHSNSEARTTYNATFQVVITYPGGATATGTVNASVTNVSIDRGSVD